MVDGGGSARLMARGGTTGSHRFIVWWTGGGVRQTHSMVAEGGVYHRVRQTHSMVARGGGVRQTHSMVAGGGSARLIAW